LINRIRNDCSYRTRANDNIEFGLIYDTQRFFYKYNDLQGSDGLIDIYNLQMVKANEMKRFPAGKGSHGYLPGDPDPNHNVYTEVIKTYSSGQAQESRRDPQTFDILTKGYNDAGQISWQKFLNQGKVIYMVYFPNLNITTPFINFRYSGSQRNYAKPELAAALIGAFADIKLHIVSGGLAFLDGTCFPSGEHVNGDAIDTSYLNHDATSSDTTLDVNFITALHKFGITSFRIGPARIQLKSAIDQIPALRNIVHQTAGDVMHNSHLHSAFVILVNNSEKQL
jgi:hypothetical protein